MPISSCFQIISWSRLRASPPVPSGGLGEDGRVVIPDVEIPSGTTLVYEVDADLRPIPKELFAAAHGDSIRAIMTYREDMAWEIIPGWQFHQP